MLDYDEMCPKKNDLLFQLCERDFAVFNWMCGKAGQNFSSLFFSHQSRFPIQSACEVSDLQSSEMAGKSPVKSPPRNKRPTSPRMGSNHLIWQDLPGQHNQVKQSRGTTNFVHHHQCNGFARRFVG